MEQVRGFMFVEISGRAVAPPPRSVHRSCSQILSDFQRLNKNEDNMFNEMWSQEAVDGIVNKVSFSPLTIVKEYSVSLPVTPEKESADMALSLRRLFQEVAHRQESDNKCPVTNCVKDVHHGKPCEKVPDGAHPDWAETDYATAQTYYNSVFLKDEPKTPPSQVMPEPVAPPPIKRRRASIMAPLDSKFQGKRLRFDALNTAFLYDSE